MALNGCAQWRMGAAMLTEDLPLSLSPIINTFGVQALLFWLLSCSLKQNETKKKEKIKNIFQIKFLTNLFKKKMNRKIVKKIVSSKRSNIIAQPQGFTKLFSFSFIINLTQQFK